MKPPKLPPVQLALPVSAGGTPPTDADPRTLAGLATWWEADYIPERLSMRARWAYRSALRAWGCVDVDQGPGKPRRWRQVAPPDVCSLQSVEAHVGRQLMAGRSASSVRSELARIKSIVNAAGHIAKVSDASHVIARVKAPPITEHAPRCPPRDALPLFLAPAKHDGERGLVRLVFLGARPGEACAVRPGDVDQRNRLVNVAVSRGSLRRKRGGIHTIPLDSETWRCVAWALANHDALYPAFGPAVSDARLFPFASEQWTKDYVETTRTTLGERAPLYLPAGTGLYALRHLGATLVAEETRGDVSAVMRYLGDRSPTAALGYCAPFRSRQAAPVDVIDGIVARATNAPTETAAPRAAAPRSKEARLLSIVPPPSPRPASGSVRSPPARLAAKRAGRKPPPADETEADHE